MGKRINFTTTVMEAVIGLSEGNPGAATVLGGLMKDIKKIDPVNKLGYLAYFMKMDELDIVGSNIWILYKDCCGENLTNFCSVFRALQLGIVDECEVKLWSRDDMGRSYGALVERCTKEFIPQIRDYIGTFGEE